MLATNAALASGGMTHCLCRCGCRGREPGYPGPPAKIPASGFPAPGSCRRSNATEVRGLGGPFTFSPQARSFSDTPYPAQSPGHASLLAFPSTGRLPSTISAADLRSALFEASQVLFSRPTPHLFLDGFVFSTSRRDPAPPEQCGRGEVSQVPTTFPSYVMGSQTTAERLHLAWRCTTCCLRRSQTSRPLHH
jgi:hypothetical protein